MSITNAKNETTTFVYQTNSSQNGCQKLLEVLAPDNSPLLTYGYDALDRVQTITDSDGYTRTFAYEAVNGDPNGVP